MSHLASIMLINLYLSSSLILYTPHLIYYISHHSYSLYPSHNSTLSLISLYPTHTSYYYSHITLFSPLSAPITYPSLSSPTLIILSVSINLYYSISL